MIIVLIILSWSITRTDSYTTLNLTTSQTEVGLTHHPVLSPDFSDIQIAITRIKLAINNPDLEVKSTPSPTGIDHQTTALGRPTYHPLLRYTVIEAQMPTIESVLPEATLPEHSPRYQRDISKTLSSVAKPAISHISKATQAGAASITSAIANRLIQGTVNSLLGWK